MACVCLTVLVFGFFIWPTPFFYEKISARWPSGLQKEEVYRVNRITGATEKILESGPTLPK